MVKGIFFDLGGTLYSYRNLARTTTDLIKKALEKMRLDVPIEQAKSAYTDAGREVLKKYSHKPYYLHQDFFDDTFRLFSKSLNKECNKETEIWYRELHREAVTDCLVLKEDCVTTLAALQARGFYLSVVSNIDEDMLTPLTKKPALEHYFNHLTSSEKAQSCKPDQRIFEYALELSGLSPDTVIFVGDSPEHDIIGAKSAGMRTAQITDGNMTPPLQSREVRAAPDYHISSLSELIKITEQY